MKNKVIILGIFATLLFVGCQKESFRYPSTFDDVADWSVYDSLLFRSYVVAYQDINGISAAIDDDADSRYNFAEDHTILLGLKGVDYGKMYTFWDESEQKAKYKALCRKHWDTGYNRVRANFLNPDKKLIGIPLYYSHLAVDFTSISVISDVDFDQQHLAGTPLDDIIICSMYSVYSFVKNGYDESKIWTYDYGVLATGFGGDETKMLELSPYWRSTTAANMRPSPIDEEFATLKFVMSPTVTQTHNITVTLTADDGRIFSDTLQVSWE